MQKKVIALLLLAVFVLAGCAAHVHVVGEGAQGTETVASRQFYIISLAPLNEVDTRAMAGDAEDYTIKKQQVSLTSSSRRSLRASSRRAR